MNTFIITFNGKEYPAREINLPKWGNVVIGTDSLQEELLNCIGELRDEEAERVDDGIFFYVSDEQIKDEHLADIVASNL